MGRQALEGWARVWRTFAGLNDPRSHPRSVHRAIPGAASPLLFRHSHEVTV